MVINYRLKAMRQLPKNKTPRHKMIIEAVDNYFGDCLPDQRRLKKDICLWLMKKRKGIKLNEEQENAVWYIKTNLTDQTYSQTLP